MYRFFAALIDEGAQDDLAVERVGLEEDVEAGAVFVEEGSAKIDPNVLLAVAFDDGVGLEVG
jgi:hypothetical protein